MATVKAIPARARTQEILRVAAYCRVSSDSADQQHSYQLYLNGQSYSGISKMLVQSQDGIQWNKHRVKRILEDERYMGDDRWPAVIQREQ